MTYKILALGGGGIKGILHIGVLKYLEEKGLIGQFTEVYGCSVGAAFAIGIAFGLDTQAMIRMSSKFSTFNGMLFKGLTLTDVQDSLSKKGLFSMKNLEKVFLEMFDSEGLDLRSKQISDALIPLKICASNLTKNCLTVFSGKIPVMKALLASACIPVLFHPQQINTSLYVDGGYLTNIILEYIPREHRSKTLSVSIIHDKPKINPKTILGISHIDFLYNLYKIACLYERKLNPYPNNIDLTFNVASGISDVTEEQKNGMIMKGYELTCRFFSQGSC
jgi:predicted acylesterase/phospholipase RssA